MQHLKPEYSPDTVSIAAKMNITTLHQSIQGNTNLDSPQILFNHEGHEEHEEKKEEKNGYLKKTKPWCAWWLKK